MNSSGPEHNLRTAILGHRMKREVSEENWGEVREKQEEKQQNGVLKNPDEESLGETDNRM